MPQSENWKKDKYETATITNMSESNIFEMYPIIIAHEDDFKNASEARIPTQN